MNKNTITQEDIDHLKIMSRAFRVTEDINSKTLEIAQKLQANLDAEKEVKPQLDTIYEMIHEFRNWNREWDKYCSKHPKSIDEFVLSISKKFVVKKQGENPQLSRIEETVNYIKEALQPMETDIEFEQEERQFPKAIKPPLGIIPKSIHDEIRLNELQAAMDRFSEAGKEIPSAWINERNELIHTLTGEKPLIFEPKSKTGLSVEDNNVYFKEPELTKGEILLQELVEKWKAKESKPLLTDIFIQMLKDRRQELLDKYSRVNELSGNKIFSNTEIYREWFKIEQILKNL